ncbi:DUF979 domain-containing protein [Lichenibacterium minor]|uniref:DUF979 domain-containing protein n=1 Tax=Lichenibacterium minor TaxID=2316528 RepID=A0A4Q2U1N2_9HYPH|nr:DUF979 domain-containing protein [Lichenibacterium minor]RYC30379.1 DUF979 domain-containing protein [Lichenibacterium minor]
MIGLESVYILTGLMFGAYALQHLFDRSNPRRWRSASFWGAYAVTFIAGSYLPDVVNGILVLAMVILAGFGGLKPGATRTSTPEQRLDGSRRFGNLLFVPALVIPAVTVIGTLALKGVIVAGRPLVDPAQVTLISLALGVLAALAVAFALLRPPVGTPLREGRRLIDAVSWAAALPQMLAALGAVFVLSGVGKVVASLVTSTVPMTSGTAAVVAYAVGMALFTIVMGNAFAAFPVMTAGVGLPLIVHQFGGNPVTMSALGMLSGFCGTLMTPMAANFNIVPVALLELPDRWAVIKVQALTGVLILAFNIVLMTYVVF